MYRQPTAIHLEDSDVQHHLQQIDTYCGLLKQGFRKNEIKGYFDDHRKLEQQEGSDAPAPRGGRQDRTARTQTESETSSTELLSGLSGLKIEIDDDEPVLPPQRPLRPEAGVFVPTDGNQSPMAPSPRASDSLNLSEVDRPSSPPPRRSPNSPVSSTSVREELQARTEPRFRYGRDGFIVYNDLLPGASQPQTPQDLARGTWIAPHNPAYTAPPGTPSGIVQPEREDYGHESPVRRALRMRDLRTRRIARVARAVAARETAVAAGPVDEPWRLDLEVDRAFGEENNVTEPPGQDRPVRVVSGNARHLF